MPKLPPANYLEQLKKAYLRRPRVYLVFFTIACVWFFWPYPILLTFIVAGLSYLFLSFEHFQRRHVTIYALVGLTATLVESSCVFAGAWKYTVPNMGFVPSWLPMIWGCAALAISRTIDKNYLSHYKKHLRKNK